MFNQNVKYRYKIVNLEFLTNIKLSMNFIF